jgi:hypothetical protein
MNATKHTLDHQLQRLTELLARLRDLGQAADDADGLATAKLIIAVDAACRKIERLGNDLRPAEAAGRKRRAGAKAAG